MPERIHIVLDDDLFDGLTEFMPFGTRSELLRCLVRRFLEQAKQNPALVGHVLCGNFNLVPQANDEAAN